jgi:hypothetical protein
LPPPPPPPRRGRSMGTLSAIAASFGSAIHEEEAGDDRPGQRYDRVVPRGWEPQ